MQAKMIAGHELTPGKTVKDHIHVEGTELHVTRPNDLKENRSLHGLTRTLLHNMIVGVTDGYKKELDALKAKGEGAGEYEEKYKAKCKELDDYKAEVAGEKATAEKRGLYRELLKSAGVDPKRIETVLKVSDLEGVTVKDGAIEDADKLTEGIKADWADFIATTTVKGADVAHAPKGEGGKDINEMSTAEYMKYKAAQRG